jgi:hypothetical protein
LGHANHPLQQRSRLCGNPSATRRSHPRLPSRHGGISFGTNATNPPPKRRTTQRASAMVRRRCRCCILLLEDPRVHELPQKHGPSYGFFPEPSKSILIVTPENKAAAESAFFADKGFTIVTGHRYLGSFIGDDADLDNWLSKKASAWELAVKDLATVATRYPQITYTGLQQSLQNESQFVQRVKPGIATHFCGIEKALSRDFLPALFGEPVDEENDHRRSLAGLPVKHAGIAISNPSTTATEYYEASTLVCSHLISKPSEGGCHFSMRIICRSEGPPSNNFAPGRKPSMIKSLLPSSPTSDAIHAGR